jgi:hypothetical protein
MGKAELALGVLATKRGVPLHGSPTIGAYLDDRNLIENTPAIHRMSFQGFDHQPLIRMSSTYIAPAHVVTLAAPDRQNNFSQGCELRGTGRG